MEDLRCQCGKIVCQIEGNDIIIKCRHCKRYIRISTAGINHFRFNLGPEEEESIRVQSVKRQPS